MLLYRHSVPLERVWLRLAKRVAGSIERGRPLVTVFRGDMRSRPLAGGGWVLVVHAAVGAARRRGQAERLRLVELAAGASCRLPLLPGLGWECLLLVGAATVDGELLGTLDYQRRPAGPRRLVIDCAPRPAEPAVPRGELGSPAKPDLLKGLVGARLLVREFRPSPADAKPVSQRAARSCWELLPGGVARRQLGSSDFEHTSLQRLAPGSKLPPHRHAQDEECLLLEGELFVEDRLLRVGDYHLAPAGSTHTSITTESGALLYRHGDGELDAAMDVPR